MQLLALDEKVQQLVADGEIDMDEALDFVKILLDLC